MSSDDPLRYSMVNEELWRVSIMLCRRRGAEAKGRLKIVSSDL